MPECEGLTRALNVADLRDGDVLVATVADPDALLAALAGPLGGREVTTVFLRPGESLAHLTAADLAGLGLQRIP